VEGRRPLVELDIHIRLEQPQRVRDGLIAVRIELRGGDARGGQAGQVCGSRRRRIRGPGCGAQVVAPRCGDLCSCHEWGIGEVQRRPGLLPVVELRLVEQLEADRGSLLVPGSQRDRGSQPCTGGVAADSDAFRIDAELGRVFDRPVQRVVSVLEGGGEAILGSPAVPDRDHHGARALRDPDGPWMLGLEVPHDEAAPVQPDDRALGVARAIDPHRYVRVGTDRAILDSHACGIRGRRAGGELGESATCGDRVRQVGRREDRDRRFQLGINASHCGCDSHSDSPWVTRRLGHKPWSNALAGAGCCG
jgi:hypothetical protein